MIRHDTLGLNHSLQFGYIEADAPNAAIPAIETSITATATAATYSKIFAFGDSLSDAGNDYILTKQAEPIAPIYSDGRFTNGAVWVQDLATSLDLPAVTPSLAGGTDFAYGGAYAGGEPLHTLGPDDLPGQLTQFEAANPKPSASALYTLSIGGNDVLKAISTYGTSPAAALTDLQDAISNEASFIGSLASDGAKYFMVMNVPDLGKTPLESGNDAVATKLSKYYDQKLATSLKALAAKDHVSIRIVNVFLLLDDVIADPSKYGFSNVTEPVWTGNTVSASSGTLNATGSAQNLYLFFDGVHPTSAGHLQIANLALTG